MNVQVACTITGCLAWISDPIPGSRYLTGGVGSRHYGEAIGNAYELPPDRAYCETCHDNHCLGESGVLLSFDPRNWLGDKGYVGNNMITPFKKPEGGSRLRRRSAQYRALPVGSSYGNRMQSSKL